MIGRRGQERLGEGGLTAAGKEEDEGGTLSDKIEGEKARYWYLKSFSYETLCHRHLMHCSLFIVHTHGRYVS